VCRRMTAHAFSFNCTNRAFPKILGVGSSHPYWPPAPASTLNLTRGPLGIPMRFKLNSSRSNIPRPGTCAYKVPLVPAKRRKALASKRCWSALHQTVGRESP
jgi:hypothetical protein